jgi:hypothetical protein
MSSIVERLTEGVVNRDMRAESHALLTKWKKTGLLEGLEDERQSNSMARLLENQAKELLREANTMSSGDVEGFAAVAFPIVRRVFAGLIANDLVSVQPMSLPSGLIFFLDFTFSSDLGDGADSGLGRFGNTYAKSIYGTDQVGSQITGGVDLVGDLAGDLAGPRTSARGYAYASPTGSSLVSGSATFGILDAVDDLTEGEKKDLDYDPDILAFSGSAAGASTHVIRVAAPRSLFSDGDFDNLSAWAAEVSGTTTGLNKITGLALTYVNTQQIRRLTKNSGSFVNLYFVTSEDPSGVTGEDANMGVQYPVRDTVGSDANVRGAIAGFTMPLEANGDIPEIDIKVDSIAVTAQTKKLKAKWTPELGQDLNAYHNLDAEVELTSLLSEQIALEIDREILADLVSGATAATRYWSRTRLALTPRLLTSLAPSVSGTRPSLRPSTMSLLRSTVRLYVVVLTSSSADPRLLTSLSSPLASVQASLTPTRRAPSALSRSVPSARSLMSSLTPTSYATSS